MKTNPVLWICLAIMVVVFAAWQWDCRKKGEMPVLRGIVVRRESRPIVFRFALIANMMLSAVVLAVIYFLAENGQS